MESSMAVRLYCFSCFMGKRFAAGTAHATIEKKD